MPKSDRQRQKKADAKKRRQREHQLKQAKRTTCDDTLADFRQKAPLMKRFLKQRGHQQKFYDFLDSYIDAFRREAENAGKQFPSLLGVHEVGDREYYGSHDGAFAAMLGYPGLTQVLFETIDVDDEYLAEDRKLNVNGVTIAFRDEAGSLKTMVLIRKIVPNASVTEFKYAFKLVALFHELGHVGDWEKGTNLRDGRVSILDAEVYAHEYAMHRLIDGDYRQALSTYLSALEALTTGNGYQKTVADRIVGSELFAKCKEFVKTNWSDHLNTNGVSQKELVEVAGSLSGLQEFLKG
jgi:hypothetical protein